MEIIESKILGITSDDVKAETDIKVLLKWKHTLETIISMDKWYINICKSMLRRDSSEVLQTQIISQTESLNKASAFMEFIVDKIRKLQEILDKDNNRYEGNIDFLRSFRKLVKEELGDDWFEKLDDRAKEISKFECM